MQGNKRAIDEFNVEIKKSFLFIREVGIWDALSIDSKFALF